MTVRGGFFNSIDNDRLYNAEDMNLPYSKLISNGVIPDVSTALQVMASSGLTIAVQAGSGLFGGGWAYNDAPVPLTLDAAHAVLDRVDLIVMRRNNNENVRACGLFVKKGTPASNPVAPEVERSTYIQEYALAEVYIKAGATAVTQSNITDTRADTTRCGWATGLIEQLDTSTLFAQYQAAYNENIEAFNQWWESVRSILESDETVAAELVRLNLIKADKDTLSLALTEAGWESLDGYYYQTIAAPGVADNDIIIVSADPAYVDLWRQNGVICVEQSTDSLKFRATAAVAVNANILNLGGTI